MLFHLNCVVALELMFGVSEAAAKFDWEIEQAPADEKLAWLDTERDGKALNVTSLTTGADLTGLLVDFADGAAGSIRFFLPLSVARQILLAIDAAGETAGWWDKRFVLLPARQPEEIEIQRAAIQLMHQYGERAAMEAGLRADGWLELGDMFTRTLWQRVMVAVQELERTRPTGVHLIN